MISIITNIKYIERFYFCYYLFSLSKHYHFLTNWFSKSGKSSFYIGKRRANCSTFKNKFRKNNMVYTTIRVRKFFFRAKNFWNTYFRIIIVCNFFFIRNGIRRVRKLLLYFFYQLMLLLLLYSFIAALG